MTLSLAQFQIALTDLLSGATESPRFLLAVSGGLDSMVLTDLFSRSNWKYAIAHCNFQLRSEASTADAEFVEKVAKELDVKFYLKKFATNFFAKQRGLSTQEAARQLRYQWLEEICQVHGFDYLITAHHLDDSLETFLYNFTKGTGLKGLLGIPSVNSIILRPLLDFSRRDLEIYYQERQLSHREDASNASTFYNRNKIRKQVIPVLKNINPNLLNTSAKNLQYLKDSYLLFQEQVKFWKTELVKEQAGQMVIDGLRLLENPAHATLLYEFLQEKEFHPNQIPQILECLKKQKTGAIFYANNHRLLVDRANLIIEGIADDEIAYHEVLADTSQLILPNGHLSITRQEGQPDSFSKDQNIALLDAAKLQFPLQLRKWQAGDQFSPLGMHGQHKTVQDFFSDLKINRFEKEKIWILCNGNGDICWIVGIRVDDRYKIKPQTTAYYQLSYQKI